MMQTYEVKAWRDQAILYYAWEYGIRNGRVKHATRYHLGPRYKTVRTVQGLYNARWERDRIADAITYQRTRLGLPLITASVGIHRPNGSLVS